MLELQVSNMVETRVDQTVERAKRLAGNIIKRKLLVAMLACLGLVVPSDLVAITMLVAPPVFAAAVIFTVSRLFNDRLANYFGKSVFSIYVASALVLLRGAYVSMEIPAKIGSKAGELFLGIPAPVLGWFSGCSFGPVDLKYALVSFWLAVLATYGLRLIAQGAHLARPPKPADFRDAQRLRPRKAGRIPGANFN
ncbi:MAG: hypothetical protein AAF756_15610 [Pseudomonadota bacterium]